MADRILTKEQQKEAFDILGDDIYNDLDADKICKLFARSKKNNGNPRFYCSDLITIGPEESQYVKPNTTTTLGIYIANKFVFEQLKIFGYINKTIDKKLNNKILGKMDVALKEGDIDVDQYADYIDRCQWLYGGPMAHIISVSLSETMLSLPQPAKDLKAKLIKENKEALEANDPQVAGHIEKAVVTKALEEMHKKDDPSLAYFDSGCGIDAYNQYKTICVMKGAILDNTGESPTGFKVITSNYDEGVSKEDMPKIADAVVTSAYSSGVATQDSGTDGKTYNALNQRIRIQDRNSDCKSTEYLKVELLPRVANRYVYRWINDNGKLVMLTPDNIKDYVGKTVDMRSGLHCHAKEPEYCAKCVGDRPYRVGVRNIGFTFMIISGSTLNAALKKKHDVSIKFKTITAKDILKYVDE